MFLNAAFRVSAFRVSAFRVSCVLRFRRVSRFAFRVSLLFAFCVCAFRCVLRFASFRVFCVSGLMHSRLSQILRSQGLFAFRLRSLRFAAFRVSALCVSQRFGVLRFGVLRFVRFTGCVSKHRVSAAFRVSLMFASQRFAFQNALSYSEKAAFQRVRFAFQCILRFRV